MKIKLNDIDVTLSPAQLEQAHREWEGMQKDKPKIGDWVVAAAQGIIRFGKIDSICTDGEMVAGDSLMGWPDPKKNRYCRKATEAEVTFFLGLFPDRFKA